MIRTREWILQNRGPKTIKVGDRVTDKEWLGSRVDIPVNSPNRYPIVQRIINVPVADSLGEGKFEMLHLNDGRGVLAKSYVVVETKEERKAYNDAIKERRKNKIFQKEQVLRHLAEMDEFLTRKKRLTEKMLNQMPLDKRLLFLRELSPFQQKIFELLYKDLKVEEVPEE